MPVLMRSGDVHVWNVTAGDRDHLVVFRPFGLVAFARLDILLFQRHGGTLDGVRAGARGGGSVSCNQDWCQRAAFASLGLPATVIQRSEREKVPGGDQIFLIGAGRGEASGLGRENHDV
jgi:hypothetical protein